MYGEQTQNTYPKALGSAAIVRLCCNGARASAEDANPKEHPAAPRRRRQGFVPMARKKLLIYGFYGDLKASGFGELEHLRHGFVTLIRLLCGRVCW